MEGATDPDLDGIVFQIETWLAPGTYYSYDPKTAKVVPAGLMPYDSSFLFNAQDCIRTAATAYTKDGGLAILYFVLR